MSDREEAFSALVEAMQQSDAVPLGACDCEDCIGGFVRAVIAELSEDRLIALGVLERIDGWHDGGPNECLRFVGVQSR